MPQVDHSVWVLMWKYFDGSAFEVVRAYTSQERAAEDFELVAKNEDAKKWELKQVPWYQR